MYETVPGIGILARRCPESPYWLQWVWFYVCLECKSLSISLWISHRGKLSMNFGCIIMFRGEKSIHSFLVHHLTDIPEFIFFLLFLMFIHFLRETEHEWERGRERERHRIQNKLQALRCQHRAQHKAWTHKPWDHDLSQSWMLNQLSHPGAPKVQDLRLHSLSDADPALAQRWESVSP